VAYRVYVIELRPEAMGKKTFAAKNAASTQPRTVPQSPLCLMGMLARLLARKGAVLPYTSDNLM
jgi:hypothetical protein